MIATQGVKQEWCRFWPRAGLRWNAGAIVYALCRRGGTGCLGRVIALAYGVYTR